MKKLRKQIISFLLAITLVLSLTNVIAPIMSKAADPIVLEDGVYEFKAVKEGDDILYPVDSAYSMFKVWYAKLTVSDGNMTADIAMTSSSSAEFAALAFTKSSFDTFISFLLYWLCGHSSS